MTRTAGYHYPDKPDWTDGPVEDREPLHGYDPHEGPHSQHSEFIPAPQVSREEFDRRWGLDNDHLRTERRQGLIGEGARQDFPRNDNEWGNGYLDGRHGIPANPRNPHGFPLSEEAAAAYLDGHQFGRDFLPNRQSAFDDGSVTDGKIVGQCPGCQKPIRKHKTAHGDELRHLHNNHVRCFGDPKTAGADLPAAGEAAAEDVPGVGTALRAADLGGKALNGIEHALEKTPDMWAYRAESALQAYADYLGRPDANNPTGRGPDEYKARTWNAYETTRPMQSIEDRNVNTPVLPAEPIKTRNINTPTRGLEGREDDLRHSDDDDDDED